MRRLDSLTGIRALAALWVVFFHLSTGLIYFGWLTPLFDKGYLGVDLFFILSGFVISYAHQKDFQTIQTKPLIQFLALRLARIMPVHLFILMLFGINYLVRLRLKGPSPGDDLHFSLWSFVCNALNIQAWGFTHTLTWNYPAWSVSAEWFAYLLFPFLTLVASRIRKTHWNLIGMALVWLSFYGIAALVGKTGSINWCDTYPLVRVGFEFTCGLFLFNLYKIQTEKNNLYTGGVRWDIFFGLGLAAIVFGAYAHFSDFVIVPLFALLLYTLTFAGPVCRAILGNRVLVYLGEISYSLYMVDALLTMLYLQAGKIVPALTTLEQFPFWFVILKLSISIGCAHLLFRYIEKPSRNYLRDWIKGGARPHPLTPHVSFPTQPIQPSPLLKPSLGTEAIPQQHSGATH